MSSQEPEDDQRLNQQQNQIFTDFTFQHLSSREQQSLSLNHKKNIWIPIIKGKKWDKLKNLSVQNCGITPDNVYLINKNRFPILEKLHIDYNQLESKGFNILISNLPSTLQQVWLWECRVFSMEAFLSCQFQNLTQLRLFGNQIGWQGARILSMCDFPNLEGLGLRQTKIGPEGAKCLSKAKFPNLQAIDLRDDYICWQGAYYMFHNSWFFMKQIGLDEKGLGCIGLFNIVKWQWSQLKANNIFLITDQLTTYPIVRQILQRTFGIAAQQ